MSNTKTILSNTKTILLGANGAHRFDVKVQKWNYFFLGVLFIAQGFSYLYGSNNAVWTKGMMSMTFMSGAYVLIFALMNFSKSSKFAPKVIVDSTTIKFKTSLFKKIRSFHWQDIESIRFKSFRIDFKMKDTVQVLAYDCTSDISIDIKEAIRAMAEQKNIEVVGG